MRRVLVTGGRHELGHYFRDHSIWPGGAWYYKTANTPEAATRSILEAIAPTSIGPLDWPFEEPQDAADRLIDWMSSSWG